MIDLKSLREKVHHLKVLIVDDEINVLNATEEFFKKLFNDVDKAKDGQEALELYNKNNGAYDLILSDANMPAMGGWNLFKILRQNKTDALLVIMTGSEEDGDKTICDSILIKPLRLEPIVEVLNKLVSKKGL